VLAHDLEPNRIYAEASRVGNEWKKLGPKLANFKLDNKAAILYSVDSHHGIQYMPFDDRINYMTVLHQMHRALFDLNIGTDFVFPESTGLSKYKVLLVPPLYVASDDLLKRLAEYVRDGGHLVLSFKSGFTDENDTVRSSRMPGPLRDAAGFTYQEFSNLRRPLALKGDPFGAAQENRVSGWAEYLLPEKAKALAFYDHPEFGKYPAITRNEYGKGTTTYEGTYLSDVLQKKVVEQVIKMAGLTSSDQQLPASLKARHGTNNAGRRMHYYLNYSAEPQTFTYSHGAGVDLLTGESIAPSGRVAVSAWDLRIIEEVQQPKG
jgi:beta-galactosidase